MKTLMIAAAVALTAAGHASAQTGGCSTCAQGTPAYTGSYAPSYDPSYGAAPAYGYSHPGISHLSLGGHAGYGSRLFTAHKTLLDRIAFPGSHGHGRGGRGDGGQGGPSMEPTMDAAQGGTLVFPQNPYIRSPRDFFMWEGK